MDQASASSRKRRFAGRTVASRSPGRGFDVLAEVLLSSPPTVATEPEPPPAPSCPTPVRPASFVLDAIGLEPSIRRPSALAAAAHLTAGETCAAVFVFHDSRVDAHVFGERACGRLGPQHGASDVGGTVAELVGECEQIGVVLLDGPVGPAGGIAGTAGHVVLVSTPDPESLVETYREAKRWHAAGVRSLAALFVGEASAGERDEVDALYDRLHRAARMFLGEDLALLGRVGGGKTRKAPQAWYRIFSEASAAEVWPHLVPRSGEGASPAETTGEVGEADPVPAGPPPRTAPAELPPGGPAETPGPSATAPVRAPAVLSLWRPEAAEDIRGAVEVQLHTLIGERFRTAFRVDVAEPGAPPLVAVREDGGMVAVLIAENGQPVDTAAAVRWLEVHRPLLAKAYGSVPPSAEVAPSAVVLAPLEVPQRCDGIRRFLPVRCGGRKGVVLLP